MRVRLLSNLVLISGAAIGIACYSVVSIDLSGIYSTSWTDADLIRHRCPLRLVQPEWVSSQPSRMMNWLVTEMKARLALTAILWLGGSSVVVWHYVRAKAKLAARDRDGV